MKKFYLGISIFALSVFVLTAAEQNNPATGSADSIKTITSTMPTKILDKKLGVTPKTKTNWSKIKDLFL